MFTHKHSHDNLSKQLSYCDYEWSPKGIISTKDVLSVGIDWNYISSLNKEYAVTLQKFDGPNVSHADLVAKLKTKWVTISFMSLSLVRSITYLRFLLALLHKTFKASPLAIKYCYEVYRDKNSRLPLFPLVALMLDDQDAYVSYKVCTIYCILLLGFAHVDHTDSVFLLTWLRDKISSPDKLTSGASGMPQKIAVTCLQRILSVSKYRLVFWEQGGLDPLTAYIRTEVGTPKSMQLLYELIRCLWLMSFKEKIRRVLTDPVLISDMVEILKHVSKDKIVRLTLATLCNILDVGQNNQMMISYGIVRCLDTFSAKRWGDEDIDQSLETLRTVLEKEVANLSSFDVYKNEVLGLKLDMSSPVHQSPNFWHANISRFDENDYFIIRKLLEILKNPSVSPKVLAVACWDAGEIVRFHPQRNFILKEVDLKTPVILLIDHPDPEVKKEALLALQKFMIINWELLAHE